MKEINVLVIQILSPKTMRYVSEHEGRQWGNSKFVTFQYRNKLLTPHLYKKQKDVLLL
jgi:hypothetical protein